MEKAEKGIITTEKVKAEKVTVVTIRLTMEKVIVVVLIAIATTLPTEKEKAEKGIRTIRTTEKVKGEKVVKAEKVITATTGTIRTTEKVKGPVQITIIMEEKEQKVMKRERAKAVKGDCKKEKD